MCHQDRNIPGCSDLLYHSPKRFLAPWSVLPSDPCPTRGSVHPLSLSHPPAAPTPTPELGELRVCQQDLPCNPNLPTLSMFFSRPSPTDLGFCPRIRLARPSALLPLPPFKFLPPLPFAPPHGFSTSPNTTAFLSPSETLQL